MPSIGERLRLERERQGRSIPDIAASTCITTRYLTAIEQDDRKTLPGDFFYRNFVKQYASALGLSTDPLIRELDSILPKDERDVLPVLIGSYAPAGNTRVRRNRSRAILSLALLVGALAGSSALYAWWEKAQRQDPAAVAQTPPPAPQAAQASEPAPTPAPAPVTAQPAAATDTPSTAPEQVPAPQATAPVQAPPVGDPAAQPAGGVGTVKLAATERTWVSVSANGKTVFSGILEPAQTRSFDGLEKAKLVMGNAAGLDVEWNGKTIGPIGPRGQVRTVLLSGESYQIVTPAPTRGM